MALYKYTRMRRGTGGNSRYEAPDELYVNGQTLTSLFEEGEYRQLTVTGRGLKPFYVETTDYLNRSGSSINSVTVDPIEFDIRYRIKAKDDEGLRNIIDRLQQELSGVITISFKDDPDYVYEDVVMTYTQRDPEDSYTIVGLFTLTAYNPYRIGKELREERVVSLETSYVPIHSINIEFNEGINNPKIEYYNGRRWEEFTVNASVEIGESLRLRVDEDTGKITVSGSYGNEVIDLGDLPHNMVLYNGAYGRVRNSEGSVVTLAWRDKKI